MQNILNKIKEIKDSLSLLFRAQKQLRKNIPVVKQFIQSASSQVEEYQEKTQKNVSNIQNELNQIKQAVHKRKRS